jgi:hypothetical protein
MIASVLEYCRCSAPRIIWDGFEGHTKCWQCGNPLGAMVAAPPLAPPPRRPMLKPNRHERRAAKARSRKDARR